MISFVTKKFKELTITELYKILQLRAEVFAIEQESIYRDIDDKDQKALHILGLEKEEIVAYGRIFKAGDYFKNAAIGRIVIKKEMRKHGYGHGLMKVAVKMIKEKFNQTTIAISAQKHLQKFYEAHGFIKKGTSYLEDGIPHIKMIKG